MKNYIYIEICYEFILYFHFTMHMSLRKWQQIKKPENELIVQASTINGADGQTGPSIGMSYHYVHQKGNAKPCQIGKHKKLVLCALGINTDQARRCHSSINRKSIIQTLNSNNIHNISINPEKYYQILPSYKFIISPEGNGIDCHRHYEALMAGCIPIIEDNYIIRAKYGDCPILWTHDYSEINENYLTEQYEKMIDKEWDYSRLLLSYWSGEEQYVTKQRGNYWCAKLTGKVWYNMDQYR